MTVFTCRQLERSTYILLYVLDTAERYLDPAEYDSEHQYKNTASNPVSGGN